MIRYPGWKLKTRFSSQGVLALTPNPVEDAFLISFLLQSVKNTASHPCPISLIADNVVLHTQFFSFIEARMGAGEKIKIFPPTFVSC